MLHFYKGGIMTYLWRFPLLGLSVLSVLLTWPIGAGAGDERDGHRSLVRHPNPIHTLETQLTALQTQMTTLVDATNSLLRTMTSMQADIKSLQSRVQKLESNAGTSGATAGIDLSKYITVDPNPINGMVGPHLIISGVNVHVRSGTGFTDDNQPNGGTLTGLGNLVVGYNEVPPLPATANRFGSHNIIGGKFNSYSSFGGLVVGQQNSIVGKYTAITGGYQNEADGDVSSILGGRGNITTGALQHIP